MVKTGAALVPAASLYTPGGCDSHMSSAGSLAVECDRRARLRLMACTLLAVMFRGSLQQSYNVKAVEEVELGMMLMLMLFLLQRGGFGRGRGQPPQ